MAKDTEIEDIASELEDAKRAWTRANVKFSEAVAERNAAQSRIDKNKKLLQDKLAEKYGI